MHTYSVLRSACQDLVGVNRVGEQSVQNSVNFAENENLVLLPTNEQKKLALQQYIDHFSRCILQNLPPDALSAEDLETFLAVQKFWRQSANEKANILSALTAGDKGKQSTESSKAHSKDTKRVEEGKQYNGYLSSSENN